MAQTTSDLWKSLFAQKGTIKEYKFDINGTEYGPESEVTHDVESGLYEDFGIGNASIAQLSLGLYADSIPKGATIKRYVRLRNGEQVSEWLQSGIFYANRRAEEDGYWNIEAFDSMRKAETVWAPDQALVFPMTMPDAVAEFARIMGVEIDPRTTLNSAYTIDYPANEWTIRKELCFIAAAHGGNWVATGQWNETTGKPYIRLVPLLSDSDQHTVGLDITGSENNGKRNPISRVTMWVDDSNCLTAGDDTGYELEADCAHATQVIVDNLLSALQGYQYQAYSAQDANLTPAAELGDGVTVDGMYSVIARISDDGMGYPSISAPGEEELEDEYPSSGPMTQEFNRQIATTRSLITKTSEQIMLSIEGLDERVSKIELNEQDITLSVSNSETSSTIKLMAGETVLSSQEIKMSGLVTLSALSAGTTTINGECIKTGKISADRIDVGDLKFQTLWGSISKKAIACVENEIYIGGDASTMSYTDVFVRGTGITFSTWNYSESGLKMRPASSILEPITAKNGSIGTGLKPFGEVHCGKLYLAGSEFDPDRSQLYYDSTTYVTLNSDKEVIGSSKYYSLGNSSTPWENGYFTKLNITDLYLGGNLFKQERISQNTALYAELNSSKQFVPYVTAGYSIGSIGTPWEKGYFKNLYLNGTELTTTPSVSKLTNGTYSIELNSSKQLVPSVSTGFSLGSSSYPFESCYLGKGTIQIGSNSLSTGTKIGFYGATPIVRQTLSTSSNNMGFTSATSSNYLTILNNVVGILKKLGLIS